MVREIVRYGSLQGRRGRLPSKVKSSAAAASGTSTSDAIGIIGQLAGAGQQPEPAPSPPLPILTIIAKAFTEMHTSMAGMVGASIGTRQNVRFVKSLNRIRML